MTTIISLLLLSTGAVAYAIHELHAQKKLKWMGEGYQFWGATSWLRKYKNGAKEKGKFQVVIPDDNWYYNTFSIKYKEAFFGSSTFAVALTDGPHFVQAIYLLCFSGAIAIHYDRWFLSLIIIRAVFGIIFSIAYKVLAK
jgi:hypothetical protein